MEIRLPLYAKQRKFATGALDDVSEKIGYGGARGGGKSHVLRACILMRRLKHPGSKGLLLRKTLPEVRDNHRDQFMQLCHQCGVPVRFNAMERTFYLPGDSKLELGYLQRDSDAERYQGNEYDDISVDEATQMPENRVAMVMGSARTSAGGARTGSCPKQFYTCNPGGIGHKWVLRDLIRTSKDDRKIVWVQAFLRDNLHLMKNDPNYARRLCEGLPVWKVQQWLFGDWDVMEGAYFSMPPGVVRDIQVPYWAKIYSGVDYGYWPSAFACVYVARWRDSEGRDHAHVLNEVYRYKLELDEQAHEALETEKLLPWNGFPKVRYADPAVWKRTEQESSDIGRTVAYAWMKNGLTVMPARSRARVPGWMLIRLLMARGVLTISPSCKSLLEEMQLATYPMSGETVTDEDFAPECSDHALDALRYCLMSTFGLSYLSAGKDAYQPKKIESAAEYFERLRKAQKAMV